MSDDDGGGLLVRDVELPGRPGRPGLPGLPGRDLGDCRIRGGHIVEVDRRLRPRRGELLVEGRGGALLPGLADHHLHLSAMAARQLSVDVSALPRADLPSAFAHSPTGDDGWVRAVGYDDVLHGELDRETVDRWNSRVPVRLQHRSGALWVVNSPALDRLGAASAAHPGIERDPTGRPTGRLWRCDAFLRDTLGSRPPSLRTTGARLAALGITHVADATPEAGAADALAAALHRGELPQHVMVMADGSGPAAHPRLLTGPVKLIVADHALPEFDGLVRSIRHAHTGGRPVAVHCVTRTALALTLAALDQAGHMRGDRVEHCAVADPAAARELAERGIRVVTQPSLVALRGDDYWERSEPGDRPDLWRYAALLRAGVQVAPSSDAPYGDPDPWAGLRTAADRLTRGGRVLGPEERVAASTALRAMLTPLSDPGGRPRRTTAGAPADLVLLDRPLAEALRRPDAGYVRVTVIGGRIVHGAGEAT